jgi:4-hydroxybenzoate polyprenyltransferase
LLLWPCFCGIAIGHGGVFDYLLFFIGAVAMRSAGCIINDLVDKDLDAKIERTRLRPLAANVLTTAQALIAMAVFLMIGAIVYFCLSETAKYLSMIAAGMMVIYPFMKRFTYWPQLFLGFTFNIGLLIAIAQTATLTFSWKLLSLLFSLVLWTIFYDTIYAFADIRDDLKSNIKSTAMVMRHAPKAWLTLVNFLLHFLLFLYFGLDGIVPVILGLVFLQKLLNMWNPDDSQDCIKIFGYCHFWGLIEWFWLEIIRVISP